LNGDNPTVLVLSCSLNPDSNSALLAREARRALASAGVPVTLVDLRERDLPPCDGDAAYDHPETQRLKREIDAADAILIASPVYNYDTSATAKNVVELTGGAWQDKVVGVLCAAGGSRAYLSPAGLINSLMYDFRCHIVPRFVYATRADFDGDAIGSADIRERIGKLVRETVRLARGLALADAPVAEPAD